MGKGGRREEGWRGERKEKKVVVEEEKGREKEKRGRGEIREDQRNVGQGEEEGRTNSKKKE